MEASAPGAACCCRRSAGRSLYAGDWFMAWQAKKDPLAVQLGALIYLAPNAFALLFLMLQREPR